MTSCEALVDLMLDAGFWILVEAKRGSRKAGMLDTGFLIGHKQGRI